MGLTEWGDIKLGYYALTVAILNPCRVEVAFEKVQSDFPGKVKPSVLTEEDKRDIRTLKQNGLRYKDICDIYGISANKAAKIIKEEVNNE